jgi:hypothetical protein
VPSPSKDLKALAEQYRDLAIMTQDATIRRELLLTAERFERLARVREQQKNVDPARQPRPTV